MHGDTNIISPHDSLNLDPALLQISSLNTKKIVAFAFRRYGTPDSAVSTPPFRLWSSGGSDEVNRLRWGDRGVGVGHLWEPTLHEPDSRLPQVPSHLLVEQI